MDNDFKTIYDNLRAEQDALNAKMQSARGDAIKHVQEVIDAFHLLRSELKFEDDHQAKSPAEKRRGRPPSNTARPTALNGRARAT